jgi:hypothetical protein
MARSSDLFSTDLTGSLTGTDTSLVDLVDSLLGRGVVVDGEVVLGLAGIDLIYLRLAALLAAADRVGGGGPPTAADAVQPGEPNAGTASAAPASAAAPAAGEAKERLELLDLPDAPGARTGPSVQVRPAAAAAPARRNADAAAPPSRWNPDPDDVRKGVTKLVLALAEFIRQLLERQAIRRMEAGTLTDEETERLGTALSQLEETVREMAERAGLDPADVNLDLGPLGKLV